MTVREKYLLWCREGIDTAGRGKEGGTTRDQYQLCLMYSMADAKIKEEGLETEAECSAAVELATTLSFSVIDELIGEAPIYA